MKGKGKRGEKRKEGGQERGKGGKEQDKVKGEGKKRVTRKVENNEGELKNGERKK